MSDDIFLKSLHQDFPFGFHIAEKNWTVLGLEQIPSATVKTGHQFGMTHFRILADRVNRLLTPSLGLPPGSLQAGQLSAIGLITDVLRFITWVYCCDENPGVFDRVTKQIKTNGGPALVEEPPLMFVKLFAPWPTKSENLSPNDYLARSTDIFDNKQKTVAEIILLNINMANPAFAPAKVIFDDAELSTACPYHDLVAGLETTLKTQPPHRRLGKPLVECLRAPMMAAPDSIEGQLKFIIDNWSSVLPEELVRRLLLALDVLREEMQWRGLGPGPAEVLRFDGFAYGYDLGHSEPEGFSPDADWMSNVVMIAKLTPVWLDQLSKKYERPIRLLSDIPDEELDQLAAWGFTAIWLIGIWQRSPASQKIKQKTGNPEAAASAYSLYDYVITDEFGGYEAYVNLRDRAWRRGIRLASDMVPSHTGIYSRWVIEHPQWFIQLDHKPFPNYSFTGEDLSDDPRVAIVIEDGYWDRRDAAVVFMRRDKWTGETRYIYHGNDGTSMPWNDTAQLNFLLPEVREAVIQTILHVARHFPIIRFDAAMTLAKRHYQRLWFPAPGEGGAIPSRAEHGMSRTQFDSLMPHEFWREVVDRIAIEAPDTLLLAEAFWLMEGYFVRTLGMHRVYNSAFMNMLKMEDNAKYRRTVMNVLEFSPQVLKRFVNFLNNPDEETAVAQFGKGDKYFGVTLMMVTMPGLPMFGHGQIEGFAEKYGMEFRRAYWNEQVDIELVRRHEREIFPLMKWRKLFSDVENFAFYDFITPQGWVDENVFAYSNRWQNQRAIVLYNNSLNTTSGWIHTSTPINVGAAGEKQLVRRTLVEALGLRSDPGYMYIFRDFRTKLEYLRSGKQLAEEGLFAFLYGYNYHVFVDFEEVFDDDGAWAKLADRLGGKGIIGMHEAHREVQLEYILGPFRQVFDPLLLNGILEGKSEATSQWLNKLDLFLEVISATAVQATHSDLREPLRTIVEALSGTADPEAPASSPIVEAFAQVRAGGVLPRDMSAIALVNATLSVVNRHFTAHETGRGVIESHFDGWLFGKVLGETLRELGRDDHTAASDVSLIRGIIVFDAAVLSNSDVRLADAFDFLFSLPAMQQFFQFNRYRETEYFRQEPFERFVDTWMLHQLLGLHAAGRLNFAVLEDVRVKASELKRLASISGYRTVDFINALRLYQP